MPGYIRQPGPPHECEMPTDYRYGDPAGLGAVWRCECGKLYVFRAPIHWLLDMVLVQRGVPQWLPARWWEWLKWSNYD
jgi:hypothetical protein